MMKKKHGRNVAPDVVGGIDLRVTADADNAFSGRPRGGTFTGEGHISTGITNSPCLISAYAQGRLGSEISGSCGSGMGSPAWTNCMR